VVNVWSRTAVKISHETVNHRLIDTRPSDDIGNDQIAASRTILNSNSSKNPAF